jgi:uncharacterized protein DUF3467
VSDETKPEEEEVAPTFTRSSDYKRLYSNLARIRLGSGEIVLLFSQITHEPGPNIQGNIVEEIAEVTLAWSQAKILATLLNSLVEAVETELGPIPVQGPFLEAQSSQLERQRQAVRNLELVPQFVGAYTGRGVPEPASSGTGEAVIAQPKRRSRRPK